MFIAIALAVVLLATFLVYRSIVSARGSYLRLKARVESLSEEEAWQRWRTAAAAATQEWEIVDGELEAGTGAATLTLPSVIELRSIGLEISRRSFDPPAVIANRFSILGVVGNDEIAWIVSDPETGGVMELDGTDLKSPKGRRDSSFATLAHYLLFIHLYYCGNGMEES